MIAVLYEERLAGTFGAVIRMHVQPDPMQLFDDIRYATRLLWKPSLWHWASAQTLQYSL